MTKKRKKTATRPFTKRISRSQFETMVSGMVAMEITRASPGAGTCLLLDVGEIEKEMVKLRSGKLREYQTGRFGFMIEWEWRVERARSIEFGSASTIRRVDRHIESLQGEVIAGVELVGEIPELKISLSSGRRLLSFMTIESQPAWVVFLNFHESWIHVKRGYLYHSNQT
jgi:hypothetical protein